MSAQNEKIPDPKELEKEISEFLAKKFGGHVKVLSPLVMTQEAVTGKAKEPPRDKKRINFNLKPEELIAYLDQYVVKQDHAKAILATKICTHFNRFRCAQGDKERLECLAGGIKNNVLMPSHNHILWRPWRNHLEFRILLRSHQSSTIR